MTQISAWTFAFITALLAVSLSDIYYRRISNALSWLILCAGLLYWGQADGAAGIMFSLRGVTTGFFLLLLLYAAGLLGAGDVKIFAAFGAWLGAKSTFFALLFGSLAGGALTVCVILQNNLTFTDLRLLMLQGGLMQALERARKSGATVPYAAALALGAMAAGVGISP